MKERDSAGYATAERNPAALRDKTTDSTQLYCLEHGIQPDGFLTEERKSVNDDHGFSTFFSETGM